AALLVLTVPSHPLWSPVHGRGGCAEGANHVAWRTKVRVYALLTAICIAGGIRAQTQQQQPPVTLGPILAPAAGNAASNRVLNIAPRTNAPFQVGAFRLPNGEQVILVTGGVLLTIRDTGSLGLIDIEAEQLVFWTRSESNNALEKLRSNE